jgi:hypothetical protein
MAEQVVLGAGTSVDIAQVEARAVSFYRHVTHPSKTSSLPSPQAVHLVDPAPG